MKKTILAVILSLACICFNDADLLAQPTLPTNPDIQWYSSNGTGGGASPIQGMNTALLLYGTPGPLTFMYASAYLDGSGNELIYLNDQVGPTQLTVAPSTQMFSVPDIIIGNGATANDYIAAVAYVDGSNNAVVDFFDIVYSGGFLSTFTYNSTATVSNTHAPQTVHIDVIADYGNVVNNFAYCDNFVVTWDDFTTASNPNVFVMFGNLNSYSVSGTSQQMNNSGASVYGHTPDVSGIRRDISGTVYDLALVTYVGANGRTLRYGEWRAGVAPFNNRILNNPTLGTYKPRIEAMDDETNNSPASGNAVYMVAAQVDSNYTGPTAVHSTIQTYDNVTATYFNCSDGLDISSLPAPYSSITPPYDHYSPTVALGGPTDYRIQHFTNYGSAAQDILFMEPIHYATPATLAFGEFWVNSQSTTGPPPVPFTTDAYTTFANSVSGPANHLYHDAVLYAWAFYNSTGCGGTGCFEVAYKLPVALGFWGFRPAEEQGGAALHKVQVFPNPVANMLEVTYTGTDKAMGSYAIIDMAGRELLRGSLVNDKTGVDVHMLAAGTYVIKLYKGGKASKDVLFVKN